MRVDFMIVGAQKCGTTTLYSILDSHPELQGSRPKETHFFSTAEDWSREVERYHGFFRPKPGLRYFEASTTYTFYPMRNLCIWDDIWSYNPATRFIYLVRNPIERVVSGYMHTYERGYTDLDLSAAIRKNRGLVDFTRYYTQIIPYVRRFGRDQVLIIDFDELIHRRADVLRSLAGFLDVDPEGFQDFETVERNRSVGGPGKPHHKFDNPPLPHRLLRRVAPRLWRRITDNSARTFAEKPSMTSEEKRMVLGLLELEIAALEELMGKDLSTWRTV